MLSIVILPVVVPETSGDVVEVDDVSGADVIVDEVDEEVSVGVVDVSVELVESEVDVLGGKQLLCWLLSSSLLVLHMGVGGSTGPGHAVE